MYNNLVERPKSRSRLNLNRPSTRHKNVQQAQKCFEMAKVHQSRKQYESAIKLYKQALKNNPDDYKSYCNLGGILKMNGNYHQAIAKYHKALLIKQDDYKTLYNLANLYRIIGDAQKAIKTYLVILKACKDGHLDTKIEIDANNNIGICYKNTRQYQQAIKCYERVINLSQNDEIGYYNKGFCLVLTIKGMKPQFEMIKSERIEEAEQMLKKAQKINPKNHMTNVCLIELKYIKNPAPQIVQKCVLEFEEFLKNSNIPDLIKIQVNKKIADCKTLLQSPSQKIKDQPKRQIIYEQNEVVNKNKTDTIAEEQNSSKISNESPTKHKIGGKTKKQLQIQNQKQKETQLQKNIEKFLSKKQEMKKLIEAERFKQAIEMCSKITYSPPLYQFQAVLLSKAAKYFEDKKYAQKCVSCFYIGIKNCAGQRRDKIKINSEDTTIQVFNAVGDSLTMLGRHKQAIEFYRIASELCEKSENKKENVLAQSGLGYNYEVLHLLQQAQACFRKSIEMDPNNSLGYLDMAGCLHQGQRVTQALAYYKKYIQLADPVRQKMNIDNTLVNMVICYKQLHNRQKQLQTLEKLMENYDKHYNSLEQILQAYKPAQLMKVYIELASIYEQILTEDITKQKFNQIGNKLVLVYKVMIEFSPNQYLIYLDLGGCLHELQKHDEALSCYKSFLSMSDPNKQWFEINNCLSNVSLCLKALGETQQQITTLQKLIKNYDKHYKSIEDLLNHYQAQEVIKVYLQLASLYQKVLTENCEQSKKSRIKTKLLFIYEVILGFPNCQNSQQINQRMNILMQAPMANQQKNIQQWVIN